MRAISLTDGSADERASRQRHPSTRSGATSQQLEDRLCDALELGGMPHPEVAAALLSGRGRSGLDPAAFARRCGVSIEMLTEAEAGRRPRDQLPGVLRRFVPHGDRTA